MGNQFSHNGKMPVALDECMERMEPSRSQPSSENRGAHKHSGPFKTNQLFTVFTVFYCSTVYYNREETHTEVQARGVCGTGLKQGQDKAVTNDEWMKTVIYMLSC